jgi:carboxypeptidase C (cathepsin A)
MRFYLLWISIIVPLFFVAQNQESNRHWPESSTTEHRIEIDGKRIEYTAKAAHLPLHNENGEQIAQFFYVSYTAKPTKGSTKRPITFVFNGGPGSSSVWLHMGALGPKRVLMTEKGLATPPPYDVVDNTYSWLDQTDLVFIDPVETGFSRPFDGVDKKEFTGYDEDIKSVGDFIRHYVSMEGRWLSPKFLAGESYGTTRAAGLSGYLQDRHGMYLNGIILISAVLNFQTLAFNEGNDLPHALFLPSFAATAYAHGKVDTVRFPDRDDFLREVENFALGEYTLFLNMGDKISEDMKNQLATSLSNYTGLSKDFITAHHFRINTWLFTKELLRDEGFTIGRFDGLVKGRDKKTAGDSYDFDPSYNLSIYGAYTAAINDHLKRTLKFDWDETTYEILTGKVHPWNYGNAKNQYINNSKTLRSAIHKNNALNVMVCSGLFDLATPYFATDYTIDHMFIAPELKANITTKYYEAGHMMYSIPNQLEKFTKDVRSFYRNNSTNP